MSIADLPTVARRSLFVRNAQAIGPTRDAKRFRLRGWIILGLGIAPWVVLLKLCGFF